VDWSVEARGCAVLTCAIGQGWVVAGVIGVGKSLAVVTGGLVGKGSVVTLILVVIHDSNEANNRSMACPCRRMSRCISRRLAVSWSILVAELWIGLVLLHESSAIGCSGCVGSLA